jgi:hypothetical protein
LSNNQHPNALGCSDKGAQNILRQGRHHRLLPGALIQTFPNATENVETFIAD